MPFDRAAVTIQIVLDTIRTMRVVFEPTSLLIPSYRQCKECNNRYAALVRIGQKSEGRSLILSGGDAEWNLGNELTSGGRIVAVFDQLA